MHTQDQDSAHTPAVLRTDTLAAFSAAINSSFVPLEVSMEGQGPFGGLLTESGADGLEFVRVDSTPQLVERTPGTIARGGSGYYKVSLLLSGTGLLIQDGREVVMRPGDLSFYDTSRPYSLFFGENFRNLILMFPKNRLDIPTRTLDTLTAVSLRGEHELAQTVAPFIARTSNQIARLPEFARGKLAQSTVDLFTTMVSAILDVGAETNDPHRQLLQRIYHFISAHLDSPDLSPTSIAEAHFISVRHLHALFREDGTTVTSWIKERRLEKCRADLRNPAYTHLGVAAVGARWGFHDASHFSRTFRATFGISPREYRQD